VGDRGLRLAKFLFQCVPHTRGLARRVHLVTRHLLVGSLNPGKESHKLLLALQKGGLEHLCWPFSSSVHVMSVRGAPARRPAPR